MYCVYLEFPEQKSGCMEDSAEINHCCILRAGLACARSETIDETVGQIRPIRNDWLLSENHLPGLKTEVPLQRAHG